MHLTYIYATDGSKVFVNVLRKQCGYDTNQTAWIYAVSNGVLGALWILFAYLFLKNGSMCQFAGIWAILECNNMVQLLIANREFTHPILQET